MALVDDDQVEEVGRELLVDVAGLLGAGDGLVEGEVDLVGLVDLSLLDLGHRRAERLEVVRLGLVDQDVAVGEEQDALLDPGLPEPPDNLERGVGLAGARRHDNQNAILSVGDCLDRAVDGVELVVTGRLAGAVVVVALGDDRQPIRRDLLPLAVSLPEFIRRRERVEGEFLLDLRVGPRAVVEEKPVAVRAEHEGQVKRVLVRVTEGLLHPRADAVVVVLGLDHSQRNVRLEVQQVVGELRLASLDRLPADDDPPLREEDLLANLSLKVPPRSHQRRRDELRADVTFGQGFLVEGGHRCRDFWMHLRELTEFRVRPHCLLLGMVARADTRRTELLLQ